MQVVGEPGKIDVADAMAEAQLKGFEAQGEQLSYQSCGACVHRDKRADADIVVGEHRRVVSRKPVCILYQA